MDMGNPLHPVIQDTTYEIIWMNFVINSEPLHYGKRRTLEEWRWEFFLLVTWIVCNSLDLYLQCFPLSKIKAQEPWAPTPFLLSSQNWAWELPPWIHRTENPDSIKAPLVPDYTVDLGQCSSLCQQHPSFTLFLSFSCQSQKAPWGVLLRLLYSAPAWTMHLLALLISSLCWCPWARREICSHCPCWLVFFRRWVVRSSLSHKAQLSPLLFWLLRTLCPRRPRLPTEGCSC